MIYWFACFGGGLFAILMSFVDVLSSRVLNAFYLRQRKAIHNKWRYVLCQRSHCEHCHQYIPLYYLVPILGYLWSLGRCVYCQSKLDIRFILWESLAFCYGYLIFYFSSFELSFVIFSCLYFLCIIFICWIDFYTLLIPNPAIVCLFFLSILETLFVSNPYLLYSFGVACIWLIIFLLIWIFFRSSIGFGDVKIIFPLLLSSRYPLSMMLPSFASLLGIGYYLLYTKNTIADRGSKTKLPLGTFLGVTFLLLRVADRAT